MQSTWNISTSAKFWYISCLDYYHYHTYMMYCYCYITMVMFSWSHHLYNMYPAMQSPLLRHQQHAHLASAHTHSPAHTHCHGCTDIHMSTPTRWTNSTHLVCNLHVFRTSAKTWLQMHQVAASIWSLLLALVLATQAVCTLHTNRWKCHRYDKVGGSVANTV